MMLLALQASAQNEYEITVESKQPSGIIDEMLYGQLFEHIYFSANNGVWQEMIYGRSFEPEQYPGVPPRDGYFDGWFMDDDMTSKSSGDSPGDGALDNARTSPPRSSPA